MRNRGLAQAAATPLCCMRRPLARKLFRGALRTLHSRGAQRGGGIGLGAQPDYGSTYSRYVPPSLATCRADGDPQQPDARLRFLSDAV